MLTPKQNVAWLDHLDRPELRRHLFYGGARSGKTDVILTWLCIQADTYPGIRILMARRTRIAAARVQKQTLCGLWGPNAA